MVGHLPLLQKLHLAYANGESEKTRVILSADCGASVRLKMPKPMDLRRKRGIPSFIRLDSPESPAISTRP
jgi:hypothetical protein